MALSLFIFGLLGQKNTVHTNVFGTSKAKNHGIAMCLPAESKNIPHHTLQIGAINSLVSGSFSRSCTGCWNGMF